MVVATFIEESRSTRIRSSTLGSGRARSAPLGLRSTLSGRRSSEHRGRGRLVRAGGPQVARPPRPAPGMRASAGSPRGGRGGAPPKTVVVRPRRPEGQPPRQAPPHPPSKASRAIRWVTLRKPVATPSGRRRANEDRRIVEVDQQASSIRRQRALGAVRPDQGVGRQLLAAERLDRLGHRPDGLSGEVQGRARSGSSVSSRLSLHRRPERLGVALGSQRNRGRACQANAPVRPRRSHRGPRPIGRARGDRSATRPSNPSSQRRRRGPIVEPKQTAQLDPFDLAQVLGPGVLTAVEDDLRAVDVKRPRDLRPAAEVRDRDSIRTRAAIVIVVRPPFARSITRRQRRQMTLSRPPAGRRRWSGPRAGRAAASSLGISPHDVRRSAGAGCARPASSRLAAAVAVARSSERGSDGDPGRVDEDSGTGGLTCPKVSSASASAARRADGRLGWSPATTTRGALVTARPAHRPTGRNRLQQRASRTDRAELRGEPTRPVR